MRGRTEGPGPGPGQMGRQLHAGEGAGQEGCGRGARGSFRGERACGLQVPTAISGEFRICTLFCAEGRTRGQAVFATSGRGDEH